MIKFQSGATLADGKTPRKPPGKKLLKSLYEMIEREGSSFHTPMGYTAASIMNMLVANNQPFRLSCHVVEGRIVGWTVEKTQEGGAWDGKAS